ncbi:hypothetical protein CVT26_013405 [Gymnopilus dilepis]|uniref:Uncharacterized protein n=1 Tax=Gymnopilus dilepis TaxID=231916 RepID=A0A409VV44_9AGAR|nr:hypothetical protein CVT26_013405 [Gymnopilus dilepis]
MFSAVLKAQRKSGDLTVYSRPAQSVVRISWPTRHGVPIVPKGVKNYLDAKGMFWECFCAIVSEVARPCLIVVSRQDGDVLAFCNHLDDALKCGFFMNLNSKLGSTTLFSNYGHISSAKTGAHVNMEPYILSYKASASVSEIAPFFEGYLGESTSDYPGIKQLNSGIKYRKYHNEDHSMKFDPKHLFSFAETLPFSEEKSSTPCSDQDLSLSPNKRRWNDGTSSDQDVPTPSKKRHKKTVSTSCQAVSHSLQDLPPTGFDVGSSQNQYLEQLKRGDGLTRLEYESLVELCDNCNRYFLVQALRSHIPTCSHQ